MLIARKKNLPESQPQFIDLLTQQDFDVFVDKYERKKYKKGDVIIHEHEQVTGAYVLLKGQVNITKQCVAKLTQQVFVEGEGDVFGFVPLMEGKLENNITAIAIDEVEVLFIPANTFSILIHDSPAIRSYLLSVFSREIISIKSRMKFMINSN